MGVSRTITGPKTGAPRVEAGSPGSSKISRAPAKPAAGKFENMPYTSGAKPKGMSTYKAGSSAKGYK